MNIGQEINKQVEFLKKEFTAAEKLSKDETSCFDVSGKDWVQRRLGVEEFKQSEIRKEIEKYISNNQR
jgi:hypothetical protein